MNSPTNRLVDLGLGAKRVDHFLHHLGLSGLLHHGFHFVERWHFERSRVLKLDDVVTKIGVDRCFTEFAFFQGKQRIGKGFHIFRRAGPSQLSAAIFRSLID